MVITSSSFERFLADTKSLGPVVGYGLHTEFLNRKPDNRFQRKSARWNVQLAERVWQERTIIVEKCRFNVKMRILSLPNEVNFGGPVECQQSDSARYGELIPILNSGCAVLRAPHLMVLYNAELLTTRKRERSLADKLYRVILVQNRSMNRVGEMRSPTRRRNATFGNASNSGLQCLYVLPHCIPRGLLRHG